MPWARPAWLWRLMQNQTHCRCHPFLLLLLQVLRPLLSLLQRQREQQQVGCWDQHHPPAMLPHACVLTWCPCASLGTACAAACVAASAPTAAPAQPSRPPAPAAAVGAGTAAAVPLGQMAGCALLLPVTASACAAAAAVVVRHLQLLQPQRVHPRLPRLTRGQTGRLPCHQASGAPQYHQLLLLALLQVAVLVPELLSWGLLLRCELPEQQQPLVSELVPPALLLLLVLLQRKMGQGL